MATTLTLKIDDLTIEITVTRTPETPSFVPPANTPMTLHADLSRSSVLSFATYRPETRELDLTFKSSGETWRYDNVPQGLVDDLLDGRSAGEFFTRHIKPFFTAHELK